MIESFHWTGTGLVEKFDLSDIKTWAKRGRLPSDYAEMGVLKSFEDQGFSGVWVPRDVLVDAGIEPYEVEEAGFNLLCTAGVTRIWNLVSNQGSTQAFDATHTRVGVGDGTTSAAAGDTDLSAAAGSTHRWFNLVDAASTVATNTNKWTSTFATGDGNFAWNEWGICQGTSNGNTVSAPLLNHAVPGGGLGTKTSAASWAFSVTLSLT